jgi:hypothetical protein
MVGRDCQRGLQDFDRAVIMGNKLRRGRYRPHLPAYNGQMKLTTNNTNPLGPVHQKINYSHATAARTKRWPTRSSGRSTPPRPPRERRRWHNARREVKADRCYLPTTGGARATPTSWCILRGRLYSKHPTIARRPTSTDRCDYEEFSSWCSRATSSTCPEEKAWRTRENG